MTLSCFTFSVHGYMSILVFLIFLMNSLTSFRSLLKYHLIKIYPSSLFNLYS